MKVYTHKKYSYVRIAEIQKNELKKLHFDVCKQPTETLSSYYNRQKEKPDLIINAGFFNMTNGKPCFNYISDGKVVSNNVYYKWGIGVVGDTDISYGEMTEKAWTGWISGYPNLIYNGEKFAIEAATELNYKARRTVFGFNNTTLFLVCVENPGMKFEQVQDLMLSLGCTHAINLDGGGSTKMLHKGVSVTKNATNRAVDNVIAVYLTKHDSSTTTTKNKDIKDIDVTYQAYSKGKWWSKIVNYNNYNSNGYSGIEGSPIEALKIVLSSGSVQYRAHTTDGKWWDWITDSVGTGVNSYSGVIGRKIDAIQIKLIGDIAKTHNIKYRSSVVGSNGYLGWITGVNGSGAMSYSGILGKPIDKIQIYIEPKQ